MREREREMKREGREMNRGKSKRGMKRGRTVRRKREGERDGRPHVLGRVFITKVPPQREAVLRSLMINYTQHSGC